MSRAGLALEAVLALITASEGATLLLELGHGDSGQGRGLVVLSGVVVNLVDGHGGVGDVRLNGLLLDDGLDGLMNVVVLVLASHHRVDVAGGLALVTLSGVNVASSLGSQALLDVVVAAMLVAAVLDWDNVGVVLLGKDLAVRHRLLGGVVVVLVNLLVDGGGVLLMLLPLDALVLHSRGNLLVNSGVVVTRLGHEVLDGGLGRVHCVIVCCSGDLNWCDV